jgi:hypothetical protein
MSESTTSGGDGWQFSTEPCPACGGSRIEFEAVDEELRVRCGACGHPGPFARQEDVVTGEQLAMHEHAVSRWNVAACEARLGSTSLPGQVDLVEAVARWVERGCPGVQPEEPASRAEMAEQIRERFGPGGSADFDHERMVLVRRSDLARMVAALEQARASLERVLALRSFVEGFVEGIAGEGRGD